MSAVLFLALVSTAWGQLEDVQRSVRRVPQGYIQYSDPTGLKVNWKLYAPYNQWRSQLEDGSQRTERAEGNTAQPQSPIIRNPHAIPIKETDSVPYKPYSALPDHLKQLILRVYEPQRPYVNPGAFIYSNVLADQQNDPRFLITVPDGPTSEANRPPARFQSVEADKSRRYESRTRTQPGIEFRQKYESQQNPIVSPRDFQQQQQQQQQQRSQLEFGQRHVPSVPQQQGHIQYRQIRPQQAQQQQGLIQYRQIHPQQSQQQEEQMEYRQIHSPKPQEGRIPYRQSHRQEQTRDQPAQQTEQPSFDLSYYKNTPREILQLLQYQARIPYDVIANRIVYQPKTVFMPKPLPEDVKGPSYYRSKVYYLNNGGEVEDDYAPSGPAQDKQP